MTYFMVKDSSDNVPVKRHRKAHWYSLVKRELYTPAEYTKLCKYVMDTKKFKRNFVLVEVSKFSTYWLFGARFSADTERYIDSHLTSL